MLLVQIVKERGAQAPVYASESVPASNVDYDYAGWRCDSWYVTEGYAKYSRESLVTRDQGSLRSPD